METRFVPLLALIIGVSGCATELKVNSPQQGDGVAYALPKTEFTIEHTAQLKSCSSSRIEVDHKLALNEAYRMDPTTWYTIDFYDLKQFAVDSKFNLELYPNGTLKSINAQGEDQSADMAINLATAIANVAATGVAGFPVPTKSAELSFTEQPFGASILLAGGGVEICNASTRALLKERTDARGKVKQAESQIKAKTDEIKVCGDLAPDKAKSCILAAQAAVGALEKVKSTALKRINELDLALTIGVRHSVSPAALGGEESVVSLYPQARALWLEADTASADVREKMTFYYAFRGLSGDAEAPPKCDYSNGSVCQGIVYRLPAPAVFQLWSDPKQSDGANLLIDKEVMVPQRGQFEYVSLDRNAFEGSVLKLTFSPSGLLTSFTYDSTESDATDPSKALVEITQLGLEYEQARRQANDQAVLDNLDHEIQRLQKEKELKALREELGIN
ncbi:hypothetical protein [Ferrimonas balearica]|uniref:hypothetical protein n=1 Tax=Ferrimonas balearica TaxID=44012 RepID=UPI001C990458|nr:hypothetical protein [Ferrimonas balearica]MBY5921099.1 hypothetical protein [Ferrimonas balearica]MBY5996216.1 hypothetical protein [Ferrimonas balearica]